MLTNCKIIFHDTQSNVIDSGELLRGTVEFSLEKEHEFREVCIRIYGRTKIKMLSGKSTQKFTKYHIDEKITIIKKNSANDKITLSAGNHEYDFELLLPLTLPSTFNGTYGSTEYQASLILDSSLFSKEQFSKEFMVIKPLDLNDNDAPNLGLPLTIEKNTSIGFYLISCCYSCCVSKPIAIKVTTPKTAFTPRQVMDLEISVNNNSNRKIKKFLVKLIKIVEYTIQSKIIFCIPNKRIDRTALMQYETRGCDAYKEDKIELVVGFPPTEPTDVTRKNINITYAVEVIGETEWQYGNILIEIPITIGSKL